MSSKLVSYRVSASAQSQNQTSGEMAILRLSPEIHSWGDTEKVIASDTWVLRYKILESGKH
jgi:hypothetical protein